MGNRLDDFDDSIGEAELLFIWFPLLDFRLTFSYKFLKVNIRGGFFNSNWPMPKVLHPFAVQNKPDKKIKTIFGFPLARLVPSK